MQTSQLSNDTHCRLADAVLTTSSTRSSTMRPCSSVRTLVTHIQPSSSSLWTINMSPFRKLDTHREKGDIKKKRYNLLHKIAQTAWLGKTGTNLSMWTFHTRRYILVVLFFLLCINQYFNQFAFEYISYWLYLCLIMFYNFFMPSCKAVCEICCWSSTQYYIEFSIASSYGRCPLFWGKACLSLKCC